MVTTSKSNPKDTTNDVTTMDDEELLQWVDGDDSEEEINVRLSGSSKATDEKQYPKPGKCNKRQVFLESDDDSDNEEDTNSEDDVDKEDQGAPIVVARKTFSQPKNGKHYDGDDDDSQKELKTNSAGKKHSSSNHSKSLPTRATAAAKKTNGTDTTSTKKR